MYKLGSFLLSPERWEACGRAGLVLLAWLQNSVLGGQSAFGEAGHSVRTGALYLFPSICLSSFHLPSFLSSFFFFFFLLF